MSKPLLSAAERSMLESLALSGTMRGLDPAVSGRLALYKLIDETPQGWKITGLGREFLAARLPSHETAFAKEAEGEKDGIADTPRSGARHYGRKARNTSWLE
jgi:hypothetical protein